MQSRGQQGTAPRAAVLVEFMGLPGLISISVTQVALKASGPLLSIWDGDGQGLGLNGPASVGFGIVLSRPVSTWNHIRP